jgi:hypothetical protein
MSRRTPRLEIPTRAARRAPMIAAIYAIDDEDEGLKLILFSDERG